MFLAACGFEANAYRSIRALAYPMSNLDVFVGPNGVGKTNLYRALELLQSAAKNTLARDLALEGGLTSAVWAGTRRRGDPVRIRLAVDLSGGDGLRYRYEVELGGRAPTSAAFDGEPLVKVETLSHIRGRRATRLVHRDGPMVQARDDDGALRRVDIDLLASESVLGRLEDPGRYPELDLVRRTLLQWRFHHDLRTDAASPLRRPCPAVATPSLASDGSDLAAVLATLVHIRQDAAALHQAVEAAFPGARLDVPKPVGEACFGLAFPDLPHRVFAANELSDGTLRYLALAGALLAYRLPPLIALNEPEASLHPALTEPLAELIVAASKRVQIWLVTHSRDLADAIAARGTANVRAVGKADGATAIEGLRPWGGFAEPDRDED